MLLVCGSVAYKISVWKSKRERPLRKSRLIWEDNIMMDYQEVRRAMGWINLPQGRDMWRTLVSAVMILPVPPNTVNFLTSRRPIGFPRKTLLHTVNYYNFNFHLYSLQQIASSSKLLNNEERNLCRITERLM